MILIDKQGFLAALKYVKSHDVTIREKIKRKNHLFELALAIQTFLEEYPRLRLEYERETDYLYYSIAPYILDSNLVFNVSVSIKLAWQLLVQEFALDRALETKKRTGLDRAKWAQDLFDRFPHPEYSTRDLWTHIKTAG